MQSSRSLDRLSATFDDDHAVANAGLLLSATLAQHLGLKDLFNEHVDLGSMPGRANPGDKAMTLIASLIAGGKCIDDADALRAGETDQVLGHWVAESKSPALATAWSSSKVADRRSRLREDCI